MLAAQRGRPAQPPVARGRRLTDPDGGITHARYRRSHRRRAVRRARPGPAPRQPLKGAGGLDWGMQSRLAADLPARDRPHRHAGHRPRLLPGPDDRARARRPVDRAAARLRRRADDHPRDGQVDDPADRDRADRAPGQRRPERAQGTVRRAGRRGDGGRRPAERLRRRRPGLHRRRARDPVGAQHDPPGRRGPASRHPGARRDRGRPRAHQGRPLPAARRPDLRRARRPGREDLLLRRGLRHRHVGLPGAGRDGRRQEAAGARGPDDGLPGHRGRRGRRRHGPQHLPERPPGRHAPRDPRGGPRVSQAGARPTRNSSVSDKEARP